jgi:hypothetical protein
VYEAENVLIAEASPKNTIASTVAAIATSTNVMPR